MSGLLKTLKNGLAKFFKTSKNFTNGIMARTRKRRSGPRLSNSAIKWAKGFGKGTMKFLKNRSPQKLLKNISRTSQLAIENRSPIKHLKNRSPQKLLKNKSKSPLLALKNLKNAFNGTQKMLMNLPKSSKHRGKTGNKNSWFSKPCSPKKIRNNLYGVCLSPAEVRRKKVALEKSAQKNRR